MKRISIALTLLISLSNNIYANPQFNKFKQQQTKKFTDFKVDHKARYEAFKKELIAKWGVPETTSKDTFVAYSDNGNTKLVIDFEKDTIEISFLDTKGVTNEIITETLNDQLNQTIEHAVKYEHLLNGPQTTYSTPIDNSILAKIGIESQQQLEELIAVAEPVPATQAAEESITRIEKAIKEQIADHNTKESKSTTQIVKLENQKEQLAKQKEALLAKNVKTVKIKRNRSRFDRSKPFFSDIEQFAVKHAVPVELILAVTETESHFNPLAKSHIPAFGLMQIVPATAGFDVNQFKLNKKQKPTTETLYDSKQNLFYGSSYLQILNERFFKEVEDPVSRNYCVIAAYNTGVGNVARAFNKGNPNRKKAIAEINKLTPEQVFSILKKRTATETQRYIDKVLASRDYFQKELL